MLNAVSPLEPEAKFEDEGLVMQEAPSFKLVQVSGNDRALKRELGVEPEFGKALKEDGRTFIRINAAQIWVLGEELELRLCFATPLSSSRCRIALEGENARKLLAAVSPVDFDKTVFKTNSYVMTGIHHTPVLIHCIGSDSFHIYAMRSFARSTWDWLVDAAVGLGG